MIGLLKKLSDVKFLVLAPEAVDSPASLKAYKPLLLEH
jgi:hypothetical protein